MVQAPGQEKLPVRRIRGDGFTLIELLVVILIIGTLLGILMPALAGARNTARRVKCMVNLKAFGPAIEMYRNEQYPHLLPQVLPFYAMQGVASPMPPDPALLDVLTEYMDATPPPRERPDDPTSLFVPMDPYFCPCDRGDDAGRKTGFSYEYYAGVLMLFRELFRADVNPPMTVTRFYENNGAFPLLADASGWHAGNALYNQNALYYDGHADWLVFPNGDNNLMDTVGH